jgi:hypothetical protein
MLGRISAHKSNWGRRTPAWLPASCRGILFDEVHVMPCRVEDLDEVERRLINLWKPRYNIHLKAPTPVALGEYIQVPKAGRGFERRI